jgi:undecaprenol kinase
MSTKTSMPYQRDQRLAMLEPEEMAEPGRPETPVRMSQHGLLRSVRFAADGFRHALQTQRNFRIQLACAVMAIGAGAVFQIGHMEWIIVVAMIGLVLSLELINTALEAVVDMITSDYHPLAKVAKDASAAAVLIASILSVVVAGIIFTPYVMAIMRR